MAQEITETNFGPFKSALAAELGSEDCQRLCVYFNLKKAIRDKVMGAPRPGLKLMDVLSEAGDIRDGDVTKLQDALRKIGLDKAANVALSYQKTPGKDPNN